MYSMATFRWVNLDEIIIETAEHKVLSRKYLSAIIVYCSCVLHIQTILRFDNTKGAVQCKPGEILEHFSPLAGASKVWVLRLAVRVSLLSVVSLELIVWTGLFVVDDAVETGSYHFRQIDQTTSLFSSLLLLNSSSLQSNQISIEIVFTYTIYLAVHCIWDPKHCQPYWIILPDIRLLLFFLCSLNHIST